MVSDLKLGDYLEQEGFVSRTTPEIYRMSRRQGRFDEARKIRRIIGDNGRTADERGFYKRTCMLVGEHPLFDLLKSRYTRFLEWYLSELPDLTGKRVLDVGCSTGLEACYFGEIVGEEGMSVGLDVNGDFIKLARERAQKRGLKNTHFIQGDRDCLPFPDETFDFAICINSMISNRELYPYDWYSDLNIRIGSRLEYIQRVLKKGGIACMVDQWGEEDIEQHLDQIAFNFECSGFQTIIQRGSKTIKTEKYSHTFFRVAGQK